MKPVDARARSARHDQAGFTLIELLVALMLTALAVGAMAVFNDYQLGALRDQAGQVDLQSTARAVVDLFGREVRRAGIPAPPSEPSHCGIVAASSSRIRFVFRDTDPDPPVQRELEYQFGSTSVSRRDVQEGEAEPLVEDVDMTGTRLRYFDAAGAEITTPNTADGRTRVTRIEIQLSMSDGEQQARVTTNIDLRNRFFITDMRTPAPNTGSRLPACT